MAVAVALKMKLWNIGAEGQLYMGAFGAVWAAQTFSKWPSGALIPILIISGMLCGAFWGFIVGYLKKSLNVNEILTSLMLNYVATSLVNYFIYGPWRDPKNPGFPITKVFVKAARLPNVGNSRLHIGLFLAIIFAVVIWVLIKKTGWGFEIKAAGESLGGASYAGININRNTVLVFILCGAIAGLAGACEMSGLRYKLQPGNVSSGYGSLGIIVAWLSNANPLIIIIVSFLASILLIGSENLQVSMKVSSNLVQIIIGLLLVIVLVGKFFNNNRIIIVKKGEAHD